MTERCTELSEKVTGGCAAGDGCCCSSSLQVVRYGEMRVNERFVSILKENGLLDFDAVMNYQGGELYKEKKLRSIRKLTLSGSNGTVVVHLKQHRMKWTSALRPLLKFRRPVRNGLKEWEAVLLFREAGLLTMTPVAAGERRRFGLECESFSMTEDISGAIRLEDYIVEKFQLPLQGERWREKIELSRKMAAITARMHRVGLDHKDFYLGHTLMIPSDDGDNKLYIIDVQRADKGKFLRKRWVIKDLAAMYYSATLAGCITNTDRLRFFLAYRGVRRLNAADRALIGKVIRKARRIQSHTDKVLGRRS